jgi:hypothetical protein
MQRDRVAVMLRHPRQTLLVRFLLAVRDDDAVYRRLRNVRAKR